MNQNKYLFKQESIAISYSVLLQQDRKDSRTRTTVQVNAGHRNYLKLPSTHVYLKRKKLKKKGIFGYILYMRMYFIYLKLGS